MCQLFKKPPAMLTKFTLGSAPTLDNYDISMVDEFNVSIPSLMISWVPASFASMWAAQMRGRSSFVWQRPIITLPSTCTS